MKGLFIKELYNLKQIKNIYGCIALILIVYCWLTKKNLFIASVPVFIFSIMITSTFTLDHKVKWEQLVTASLPSRKIVILSKYLFLILSISAGILCGIILSFPLLISDQLEIKPMIEILLFTTNIALCSGGGLISFTVISHNAVEKMELLTIISYILSGIILFVLNAGLHILFPVLTGSKMILNLLLFFITVILFIFSARITIIFYNKKDIC